MDKNKASDWRQVKPGSVITLSDTQAIADAMRRGLGVKGIDYTVRSVARMEQLDGLSTHLLFTLNDLEQVTYLLVKIVDDAIDLYIYIDVPGLTAGARQDLIDQGMLWLFQEPPNPNQYDPYELRYTMDIRQTIEDGGKQTELIYTQKGQGELQARYTENPPRSGMPAEMLATIVEYRTAQTTANPEFLIIETGEERSDRSYVQFYAGCQANMAEVDVLSI